MFSTNWSEMNIAKKLGKCLCILLLPVMVSIVSGNSSLATGSDTVSQNEAADNKAEIEALQSSISEKQSQIDALASEKASIQAGKSNVQSIINGLENSKSELTSYVYELDLELANIQENINLYNELVEQKQAEVEQSTIELEVAQEVANQQYEAMKTRIRFMYESGNNVYLELLLSSKSFGDLLNKADYIEQLESYDRNMLIQYQYVVQYTEECKAELLAEQEVLEAAQEAAEAEEEAMNALIEQKQIEIAAYNADISEQQAVIAAFDEELASQDAELEALEAALAAEKDALAAATAVNYVNGRFVWPAPSYTRISSEFGWRTHPIYGTQKFHSGLDMAAPGGTPILAACEGDVTAAGYSSSMGNYIYIDHGGGLSTVYMHASALYVSKGDHVTAGQKIAAVGTTGLSTGNHLHFSVRLNGEYVSPWGYL